MSHMESGFVVVRSCRMPKWNDVQECVRDLKYNMPRATESLSTCCKEAM